MGKGGNNLPCCNIWIRSVQNWRRDLKYDLQEGGGGLAFWKIREILLLIIIIIRGGPRGPFTQGVKISASVRKGGREVRYHTVTF